MKTEKESSHKGTKALRKRNNYLKTSCLRDLVAKKAFTPAPICIVGEQVKNRQKQVYGQIAKSPHQYIGGGDKSPALNKLVRGFTLPELLTVIAIIVILIGVLMPALAQVKKLAKETKQKAQLGSIDVGINLYKNDFGEYPPSHGSNDPADSDCFPYCGAQTLAEAMFGQDLLGFHQKSIYRNEGKDNTIPDASKLYTFAGMTDPRRDTSLSERKEPYLDRTNIGVFTPRQIFNRNTYPSDYLVSDRYVICDVFTAVSRKIEIGGMEKTYKVGSPVLYFRANPSPENTELFPYLPTDLPINHAMNIYNYRDNYFLIMLKSIADGKEHPLNGTFYGFIGDRMIGNFRRPVRPDSFLLISAGSDGLYGTKDDICNFDPNLPG